MDLFEWLVPPLLHFILSPASGFDVERGQLVPVSTLSSDALGGVTHVGRAENRMPDQPHLLLADSDWWAASVAPRLADIAVAWCMRPNPDAPALRADLLALHKAVAAAASAAAAATGSSPAVVPPAFSSSHAALCLFLTSRLQDEGTRAFSAAADLLRASLSAHSLLRCGRRTG